MIAAADISGAALRDNFQAVKRLSGGAQVICVLKGNAYGHGAIGCFITLWRAGARHMAVATAAEAARLLPPLKHLQEESGEEGSLLLLGPVETCEAEELCLSAKAMGFSHLPFVFSVHSLAYAEHLSAIARRQNTLLPIQLKVETGLNRLGFETSCAMRKALSLPGLTVQGIYSHFGAAGDPTSPRTALQTVSFFRVREELRALGIRLPSHLSASSALLRFGSLGLDAVRCGMLLYGISPFSSLRGAPPSPFRPVMRLWAKVLQIRQLEMGECIGYDTRPLSQPCRVAVLGIGYADGIPRQAVGAHIHLSGAKVPLCGAVCMDRCFADIGLLPVKVGDKAIFYGLSPGDTERFCAEGGLSSYELLTGRQARLPLRLTE